MAQRRDSLDQLLARLNISGLQRQNTALYEVIAALIRRVKELANEVDNSGSSTVTQQITQVIQFMDPSGDSGGGSGDGEVLMINSNNNDGSSGGMMPFFIPLDETFIIPENKQGLFEMTIDVEGILQVDGFLIQVD